MRTDISAIPTQILDGAHRCQSISKAVLPRSHTDQLPPSTRLRNVHSPYPLDLAHVDGAIPPTFCMPRHRAESETDSPDRCPSAGNGYLHAPPSLSVFVGSRGFCQISGFPYPDSRRRRLEFRGRDWPGRARAILYKMTMVAASNA